VAEPRALHIGIDGRELVGRPTGVGRYLASLLRVWAADADLRHRFTVFLPTDPPDDLSRLSARIDWVIARADRAGTWWEQTRLARAAARAGLDAFFAAGYTAPLTLRCPLVLTVYDVSFYAHPEWFGRREGMRRRWLTRASARRARTVISISQFSAGEIVRFLGIPRDRIRLASPGAPPPPDASGVSTDASLVLFVGSLFNRRRIPELLGGFARAAARVPEARLVLVGDNRTNPRIDPAAIARDLGVADRVEWRAYVPETELQALYGSARVFAFLSDYEGFGMTPFEAMAHGVPPVLLDTPVGREVYGDSARFVRPGPDGIAEIADALTTLLTDETAHAALVAAGRRRLARGSWRDTAATVLAALEQAAGRP